MQEIADYCSVLVMRVCAQISLDVECLNIKSLLVALSLNRQLDLYASCWPGDQPAHGRLV